MVPSLIITVKAFTVISKSKRFQSSETQPKICNIQYHYRGYFCQPLTWPKDLGSHNLQFIFVQDHRKTKRSSRTNRVSTCSNSRHFSSSSEYSENTISSDSSSGIIRFLGMGESAIIRPGVVLVAPKNEYHHFYRRAAIFVYAMGEDPDKTNNEYVIRGVIIDHPTPFTLSEMMAQNTNNDNQLANNPIGNNLMFRGGDTGGTGVILLHNKKEIGLSEIGLSGIYQGGWDDAVVACGNGEANPNDFKVFFNYCEFTEVELDALLKKSSDGIDDQWCSVEIDPCLVLSDEWERGDCWSNLRNALLPYLKKSTA